MPGLVDIHCHLLPGIDDGAEDLADSIAMARQSVEQGVDTIITTPHQLGGYHRNRGDDIRRRVADLNEALRVEGVPLRVLPGADVRIEDGMTEALVAGDVVTLGDHRRHVLLELPHEIYLPLEPVLAELDARGMVGILSHPERNAGLLHRPDLIDTLVDDGCLMQVTAGSFLGAFGKASQALAERMAKRGALHFVSTDAHGAKARRPRLGDAMRRVAELAGEEAARQWCGEFPRAVAEGRDVPAGVVRVETPGRGGWSLWRRRAA